MYKNGKMSKTDTADYFKELPFYNKPIKKYKHNGEIEFAPVYFNLFNKSVIKQ